MTFINIISIKLVNITQKVTCTNMTQYKKPPFILQAYMHL